MLDQVVDKCFLTIAAAEAKQETGLAIVVIEQPAAAKHREEVMVRQLYDTSRQLKLEAQHRLLEQHSVSEEPESARSRI